MQPAWLLVALVVPRWTVVIASPSNLIRAERVWNDCDPDYFAMSRTNLAESGSDKYYLDFIAENSTKYPKEYERQREVGFFARRAFNGDVYCSINGCTGIPTCKHVLDHVKMRGGDKAEARDAYFSIKKIEYIVEALQSFHRISEVISHHAGLVSDMLVRNFDVEGEMNSDPCRMVKAARKLIFSLAEELGKRIESRSDGLSLGSIFLVAAKLVEEYGDDAETIVDSKMLDKLVDGMVEIPKRGYNKVAFDEQCPLEGVPSKKHKTLDKEQTASYQAAMLKKHIGKAVAHTRQTIAKILDTILAGNALNDPKFNALYELMSHHDWSETGRKAVESFNDKTLIEFFERGMIKQLWREGRCYTTCGCSDKGTGDLCTNTDRHHRFCPNDGSGCACQLHCFPNDGRGKNEIPLLGADLLPAWDVSFREVLEDSYMKYLDRSPAFYPEPDLGSASDFEDIPLPHDCADVADLNKVDVIAKVMDLRKEGGHEPLALPVCMSSQLSLGGFSQRSSHPPNLPCTCGDWRSSETQDFLEQIGLGTTQPGYKASAARQLLGRNCASTLAHAQLPPLNHFLAYCELGIRFPHRKDTIAPLGGLSKPFVDVAYPFIGSALNNLKHPVDELTTTHVRHAIVNQIDSRCAQIKEETESMSENDANLHFCTMSEAGKAVFADERSRVSGTSRPFDRLQKSQPIARNHEAKCRRWLSSSGK